MSAEAPVTTPERRRILPVRVTVSVRVFAWLSFIAEVMIVGTGGAVRLTDSGLGCGWPLCTPDSLAPTPAMGIHSFIEFGNRMMSGVVGILALVLLILVWRLRKKRRDLWWLSFIVVLGVLAQAIVGGLSVRTDLNGGLVAFHYLASITLVAVSAAFLARMDFTGAPRALAVPRWFAITTHVTSLVLALVLILGVTTTANGPHSGDPNVVRHGFDVTILEHLHATPAYVLFALTLLLTIVSMVQHLPIRRWLAALLGIELVQIGLGLYQSRAGLPPLSVGVHMVVAALLAATMVAVVTRLKTEQAAASAVTQNA
jgi:cytochrome c oxidase assembly protein subunit 15